MKPITDDEKRFIEEAAAYLEFPSLAARVADVVGKPVEKGIQMLPAPVRGMVEATSRKAIESALEVALSTIKPGEAIRNIRESDEGARDAGAWHVAGTGLTGALGGVLGLPGLALELPVTTTVMLRAIADVAARFGEDLSDRRVQLDCLAVFSLGGPTDEDDALESSYYTSRIALAQLTEAAARFIAGKSAQEILRAVQQRSAPPLVALLVRIASRFNVMVGQKALGQLVPVLGAAGGAVINAAFTEHYHRVARYHFGLKKLEREHGTVAIRSLYAEARAAAFEKKV